MGARVDKLVFMKIMTLILGTLTVKKFNQQVVLKRHSIFVDRESVLYVLVMLQ